MGDTAEEIAADIAAIGRIEAVPTFLRVLCDITGMRFAAVARVTDGTWTACAVQDEIAFGLAPGGQLDLGTTLCKEVRASRVPIAIDHASQDAVYCHHHTPRIYAIESYVSVPIVLPSGEYFGNLCAIDPQPAKVNEPRILSMFTRFAELIAVQLDSERRQAVVQAALLDERAAGELREQLVTILGHDLRIPLGMIAVSCELLNSRSADPSIAKAASDIRSGTKRISALVDDVLDFARSRLGGAMGVKLENVDRIDEALFGVVAAVQEAHPGRAIEWQFDVGHTVRVDRGRIQQLAASLLTNALTHGAQDGTVKLGAATTADEFALTVWNAGEPIPPQRIDKVFDPVWRSTTSTPPNGLGLGLHICAQIVKAHGGRLAVSSSAEQGTTFTATLPRRTA